MTGQTPDHYSTRQGAYDPRKLRGKQLVIKPGRTRRYHLPEVAARTIAALLTVRDKVIAPLIAGIRTPGRGRPPKHWTNIDRDYETLRLAIQTLFCHLGHRYQGDCRHIDNILSIAVRQASRAAGGQGRTRASSARDRRGGPLLTAAGGLRDRMGPSCCQARSRYHSGPDNRGCSLADAGQCRAPSK